jgi:hypothetical protein
MKTRCARIPAATIALLVVAVARADAPVQLDPFAQVTSGYPQCPAVQPPLLSAEDARHEAHVRVERGLRCAMDGTCEPGGAYKRDPEINERVRQAIAREGRFADTSLWITTTRKWVTLQGCVRSSAQRRALVQFVKAQPNVERVFDEVRVGAKGDRSAGGKH